MRTRGFAGNPVKAWPRCSKRNPRSEEFFPMKKYLLSLSLAAAMAAPAVAQQNQQTTPSDQPQTQQAQSSNDQTATGKDPLTYQRKEGFWGHLNPFAQEICQPPA